MAQKATKIANRWMVFIGVTALIAVLSGCGGSDSDNDSDNDSASGRDASSPWQTIQRQATAAVPEGYRVLGGPEQGFTVAVPPQFTDFDPTGTDIDRLVDQTDIADPAYAAQVRRQLRAMTSRDALLIAFDLKSGVDSGYSTNVSAACSPVTSSRPSDLTKDLNSSLTRIGAKELTLGRKTIGGVEAVTDSYQLQLEDKTAYASQVVLPAGPKRACALTFGTDKPERYAETFEQIANTFRVLPSR